MNKETKLVITIDDSSLDAMIEKVKVLRDELSGLGLPIDISGDIVAKYDPEEEKDTPELWSVYLSDLDHRIAKTYSELIELLNMRNRVSASYSG